ncbi:F-box/FBD/LRR-repeat protein-like protein [Tanacetum coccineum]
MDMFGKLPLCIIETILYHLTTKEAVRTSILSRDWRYRWINIPKLEFIDDEIEVVISCTILSNENSDIVDSGDNPTIISLFECLPVIESLSISLNLLEGFVHDRDLRELPTSLIHLKYLFIDNVFTYTKDVSPNLNLLIRSAPNLEKLKILDNPSGRRDVMYYSILEDYSDMWLEHLNELEITIFGREESVLDFVKIVLAKSPRLKKVGIRLHKKVAKAEEYGKAKLFWLSEIFFRSASLKAYIDLELVLN